jgi:hypothetical protein
MRRFEHFDRMIGNGKTRNLFVDLDAIVAIELCNARDATITLASGKQFLVENADDTLQCLLALPPTEEHWSDRGHEQTCSKCDVTSHLARTAPKRTAPKKRSAPRRKAAAAAA